MTTLLLLHIVAGSLGILSGFVALYTLKGATLHRRAGMFFVCVMLTMAVSGAALAAALGAAPALNIPVALLTAYLVVTALTTVRRPARGARWLDLGGMLVALGIGLICLALGFQALAAGGRRDGMPAAPFLLFGAVALLASALDLRMIRAGGLRGAARLARHLWRMSFALAIAALSFFIGQADVFPEVLRIPPLLALPVVAVLLTMLAWLWRLRTPIRRPHLPVEETPMQAPVKTAFLSALLIWLLAPIASAQENPLSTYYRGVYGGLKHVLLRAAEKMPEANYAFRPTDAVRSYGQILGHLADSQYTFCSIALGETNPAPKIEQTKSSKADLVAALEAAFAYCDRAFAGITDATGAEMVMLFGSPAPRLGVLSVNNLHGAGHYGNLVTYLRMKGIVPPTSEPGFVPRPRP